MGTDKKVTAATVKPAPGVTPEQPNPFKGYSAPGATQAPDGADAQKD